MPDHVKSRRMNIRIRWPKDRTDLYYVRWPCGEAGFSEPDLGTLRYWGENCYIEWNNDFERFYERAMENQFLWERHTCKKDELRELVIDIRNRLDWQRKETRDGRIFVYLENESQ
jgi:hypothetical protein